MTNREKNKLGFFFFWRIGRMKVKNKNKNKKRRKKER